MRYSKESLMAKNSAGREHRPTCWSAVAMYIELKTFPMEFEGSESFAGIAGPE